MKKFLFILFILTVGVSLLYAKTYTRKTDAADHQWETTSSWDLDDGTVPATVNDTAVFPVGVFPICTLTSNRTIACLIINDTILLHDRFLTLQGGNGPMVVNNGARFTNNTSGFSFKPIISKSLWSMNGSYDFDGSGFVQILAGATNLKDTLTALNYTGTNILDIYSGTAGYTSNYFQVGKISTGGTFRAYAKVAETMNYTMCPLCSLSCNEFRYGSNNAGGVFTFTQNSGTIICQKWYGDAYALGTSTFNSGTGTNICTGDWSFSAAHSINMGTSLSILSGSGAQTITSNTKLFYDLTINNSSSDIATCPILADSLPCTGDVTLTDGPFNAATYAIKCVDFTHTTADSTRYNRLWLSGDYTRAAGATKNDTAGQHLRFLAGTSHTAALAGKTYAQITLNGPTALNGGATIRALSYGVDGVKGTIESGTTITVTTIAIGGTALAPDTLRSVTPTSRATYTGPSDTLTYTYVRDIAHTNTRYLDSTANTGGNNTGLKSLSYTSATLSDTTGAAGDTITVSTGNGLIGGGASVGDSVLVLTVVNSDSGSFILPAVMPAGTYDVKIWNSDADTVTLSAGLTIPSSGGGRNGNRRGLGIGLGIFTW